MDNKNVKLLIFSDSHGRIGSMQAVLEKMAGYIDVVLHLGDNVNDIKRLNQVCTSASSLNFFYVPGNCDYHNKTDEIIELNGRRILLTHGHVQNVKQGLDILRKTAAKNNVDACFFGHTHVAHIEFFKDILILNPGSISFPRGRHGASYAVVEVPANGRFYGNVVELTQHGGRIIQI